MGDISDYYRAQDEEEALNMFGIQHNYNAQFDIWTTRTGEKIPVKEMTDTHLLNTINMLNKNANEYNEDWFDILVLEAHKRKLKTPNKSMNFECDATEIDIY